MARRKKDKYDLLKSSIIADMEDRGTWRGVDEHLVDEYIQLIKVCEKCSETITEKGIFYEDERGMSRTNPAIRTLNATTSSINALARTLGIGPYSRKLTTGTDQKKPKAETRASMLNINRKKKIG